MRRGSFVGPILLILVGALFLINNLNPDLPVMELIGAYWPYVLIMWGVLRLVEICFWSLRSQPLPMYGVSGGEWALVVFLCLIGSAVYYGSNYAKYWPQTRITMRGLEVLGESFDFPVAEQKTTVGKTPRIVIENLRGNVRVVGADTEELTVGGRTTVRAFQNTDAEAVNRKCPLEVVRQGDVYLVRTNQENATGPLRITSNLEITAPRGATIECRGRSGDIDVSEVTGTVDITNDNAGVRMNNLGGDVHIDIRRSDVIRASNVKGSIEIKGAGNDIDLENIGGQATINGNYSGEMLYRNLAKPLRFQSSYTDLRAEQIAGQIRMTRGDMTAANVTGPFLLKADSKDVELNNVTESIEIAVNRGDIEIHPERLPLGRIDARTRAGDIRMSVPPSATFQINASTERGEIENEYGGPLEVRPGGERGARLTGAVGAGPLILLTTDRGKVALRKGGVSTAANQNEAPQERLKLEVEQ